MAAPIAGVAPIFAIFFGGCEVGRRLFREEGSTQPLTFVQNFYAGGIAGILTAIV